MKKCAGCNEEKPLDAFYCRKDSKDGLFHKCKACVVAYSSKYKKDNKTKARKHSQTYYGKNKDKVRAWSKKWREDNPTKWKASQYKWRKNVDYTKADATPSWVDLNNVSSLYTLAVKLKKLTGINYDVDHIVPLRGKTICGLNVPWNLQILPECTNRSKSNKEDWVSPIEKLEVSANEY